MRTTIIAVLVRVSLCNNAFAQPATFDPENTREAIAYLKSKGADVGASSVEIRGQFVAQLHIHCGSRFTGSEQDLAVILENQRVYELTCSPWRSKPAETGAFLESVRPDCGLTNLNLFDVTISKAAMRDLSAIPTLERIHLRGDSFDDDLLKMIGERPSAKELSIVSDTATDEGMSHVVERMPLRVISVSGRKIRGRFLNVANLRKHLTTCSVVQVACTDDDIEALWSYPNLTFLRLSRCIDLSDEGIARIASLTQLESTDLSYTKVGDKTIAALASLKSLRHLGLNSTLIDDDHVLALCENPSIQRLQLDNTLVGVRALEVLVTRENLKELSLRDCLHINEGTIPVLMQARHLTHLDLAGANMSRKKKLRIVDALGIGCSVTVQ